MKKAWWFFYFFAVSLAWAEDQTAFVYNENGKRDPFGPLVSSSGTLITYDSDMTATDMVLEGIVLDAKGNNLAIINGKIVKLGEQMGSYTVEFISNDYVNLVKGQEHLKLKLKKRGI